MKLIQVSSTELIKFLETKGFILHHSRGSHFVLIKPGTARIVVPFRNEIATGTTLAILRETGISREEYSAFFSRKG
jgi:predicted RNA binding protein YcfA (HicA-like mRNA interferase family)